MSEMMKTANQRICSRAADEFAVGGNNGKVQLYPINQLSKRNLHVTSISSCN